ncbi:MAG: hypothetical protein QOK15_678 [Nocardioidaceae bacterium]|nr:hypothetical protein [Nocardioidaceae bacterium]
MTSTAFPPSAAGPLEPTGPVQVLLEASRLIDQAAETLWAARTGAELTATVDAVSRLRAKLDGLELAVVQELDAGPTGQAALKQAGWASVKDYVTHATGGRKGAGPSAVRLVRQLEQLPALADALAAGTLSRVKAQIIATAVDNLPCDRELRERASTFLLEQAGRLSADDLERAGRHVMEVVDPDGVDAELERGLDRAERASHLNRDLVLRFDRLGGGDGRFHGSKEDVLLLKTVLLSLAAPEPAEPGSCGGDGACASAACRSGGHSGRDPREHGSRMFDALVQLARMAQAAGDLPDCHGGVPQVVVTMDFEDLSERVGQATTTLGEDVDAETVRRMSCDADVIPGVLGRDGSILDVGRAQRLVTAAIWVALVLRDQRCAFPGCRRPPVMCHAHHIQHWVDGGSTGLDNLVLLCGTHHRIIHSTPWEVRLSAIGRKPEFRPPDRDVWLRDRSAIDRPPDEQQRPPED